MTFDQILDRIKHSLLTLGCAALLLYFVLPGIIGDRGLFAMARMHQEIAVSKADLESIKTRRMALEARAKLLRPDNLDLDMLDERARATLGMTKPNEYVIYYDQDAR